MIPFTVGSGYANIHSLHCDTREKTMTLPSRRTVNQQLLGSLMTYGLIETLFHRDLFADAVKPVIQKWLVDLHELSRSLKDHKLKDIEFQAKLEELYKKVDLAELVRFLELDASASR